MDEQRGRTPEERSYYALSTRVYRAFAPFYDLVASPLRGLRREVAAVVPIDGRSRVLDVATGTGSQAIAFAEKAGEVVGIDLSESMLGVARKKNRFSHLTFRQGDATELPFENASFDVACISFALHEMPRSVRERTLREMARVVKPSGDIVIVDYALPASAVVGAIVYHVVKLYERDLYAEFVRTDLPALLDTMGIAVREKRRALGGLAQIVVGARPEATRSERRNDCSQDRHAPC